MSTPNPIQPDTAAKSAHVDGKFAHISGIYSEDVPGLLDSSPASLRQSVADPILILTAPIGTNVHVHTDGIISDNDDTIAERSGHNVHDGHTARFARGLSLVLMGCHTKLEGRLLTQELLERYEETHSIFDEDGWAAFKGQGGQSEGLVLKGMLNIAKERFPLAKELLALTEFELAVNLILEDDNKFQALMTNVTADRGLVDFFTVARDSGIPIAVCSASQEAFVGKALAHLKVQPLVQSVIGGASKKTGNTFNGEPVAQACQQIGVDPGQAVMFGDSIGDVGAAVLAGIGVVIIRLHNGEKSLSGEEVQAAISGAVDAAKTQRQANFTCEVNSFQRQPHYHEELTGRGHPIAVVLVSDFNQVKLGSTLPESGSRASFSLQDEQ